MDLLNNNIFLKGRSWSFNEYIDSIRKEQDEEEYKLLNKSYSWQIRESVIDKVSEHGEILPFYGDTIVYPLTPDQIKMLKPIQDKVYNLFFSFSNRIKPSTFHITIHDLINNKDAESIREQIKLSKKKVNSVFQKFRRYFIANPDHAIIRFTNLKIFAGYHIAITIGMEPETKRDFNILMNFYKQFEDIVELPYMLRPHVTIAYFKPINYLQIEQEEICAKLREFNLNHITLPIDLRNVVYQYFTDMNTYVNLDNINN